MISERLAAAHRNALLTAEASGHVWLIRDLADPVETRTPTAEPYRFVYES